jgi:hypothetical protein
VGEGIERPADVRDDCDEVVELAFDAAGAAIDRPFRATVIPLRLVLMYPKQRRGRS